MKCSTYTKWFLVIVLMIILCAKDSAKYYRVIYVNFMAILLDIITSIFISLERLNTCLKSYRLGSRTGIQTQVRWIPNLIFPSNALISSSFKYF